MKKESIEIINKIAENFNLTVEIKEDKKEVTIGKGLTSLTIGEDWNEELYYEDIKTLVGSADFVDIPKIAHSIELIKAFMTRLEENIEVHPF